MLMNSIPIEKKILPTVRHTISDHRMVTREDAVLVAVSGGPDSVALVHVMLTLAAEYSLHLAIAHLNHGLRGADQLAGAATTGILLAGLLVDLGHFGHVDVLHGLGGEVGEALQSRGVDLGDLRRADQ